MKTSMPRALLALFCLLASLAHAAPNSILHRPYDLDTGHGVGGGGGGGGRPPPGPPPGGGGGGAPGHHPPPPPP
ncbi:alpha/beta hydrolase, partial [Pseudomonas aeruginosa]|nr:alpha/beta hydrolase [Pseudomonas aeruginosa]